jgi:hypothetical protein
MQFIILDLLLVSAYLLAHGLLLLRVAHDLQQLIIALLLPMEGLELLLGHLLLLGWQGRAVLRKLVTLLRFLHLEGVDALEATQVAVLENFLLLLELLLLLLASGILLFEGQLGQHAVLLLFVEPLDFGLFLLDWEAQESESVHEQVSLDVVVQGGVCGETWSMVDLEEDGLVVFIEDYIEAEDLESHEILQISGLAGAIIMR